MSDDVKESGQETEETQEQVADPVFSKDSGGEQTSESTSEKAYTQADLDAKIEEARRQWQGNKDRSVEALKKDFQEITGVLGSLKGVVPDNVLAEINKYSPQIEEKAQFLNLQEQVSRLSQQLSTGQADSGSTQEKRQDLSRVKDVFVQAGLAPDANSVLNSPDYINFFKMHEGKFEDEADMVMKAAAYSVGAKSQPKTVSSAALAQGTGGGSATPKEQADLEERYLQLSVDPVTNAKQLAEVEKQLQELGAWQ